MLPRLIHNPCKVLVTKTSKIADIIPNVSAGVSGMSVLVFFKQIKFQRVDFAPTNFSCTFAPCGHHTMVAQPFQVDDFDSVLCFGTKCFKGAGHNW